MKTCRKEGEAPVLPIVQLQQTSGRESSTRINPPQPNGAPQPHVPLPAQHEPPMHAAQHSMPTPPPLPPRLGEMEDEALNDLLLAWYYR
jgi:hypothetical protein